MNDDPYIVTLPEANNESLVWNWIRIFAYLVGILAAGIGMFFIGLMMADHVLAFFDKWPID